MYLKDMDDMMTIFLLIILSIGVGESLTPIGRYAHSSVLVDKRIYFFGGGKQVQFLWTKYYTLMYLNHLILKIHHLKKIQYQFHLEVNLQQHYLVLRKI